MMAKFYATVNEEGASKALRGKIPVGLSRQLGAAHGDIIEFEVTGKVLTGGRVLRSKKDIADAKEAVHTQSRLPRTSAPRPRDETIVIVSAAPKAKVSKPKRPTRPVAAKTTTKAAPAETKPVAKKAAKPSKRKTSVAVETPAPDKPKRPSRAKK